MAKNSDQRAGGFEADNTGGVLSGLLAEEEHLDRRAMFRLGTWGVVSVGAVVVAVLANQSGMKSRRDEIAALDVTRQSQQIQSVARESQNETRRLAAAIDTLNSDRDRMYSRLTGLEQGLESVTGAIARQNAAAPPPAATSPAAIPPAAPQPVAQSASPEPAPVTAPVTTVAAAVPGTEKPASERSRTESKKSIQARAAPVAAVTPAPSDAAPATSATPLMASKSTMGPPDPATGKSIEPKSIEAETPAKPVAAAPPAPAAPVAATPAPPAPASATAAPTTAAPATSAAATPTRATTPEPAPEVAAAAPAADKPAAGEDKKDGPDAAPAPQLAVNRTEFGVDVGGANSVGGLRALWRGLLKWRANAALAGLQPILVVKEGNNGLGMQLRLVAGPLSDAAAAAKICASMTANDRHCETTVYDGQRLALKAEDIPTTTESISAKPSAERPSSENPSDPAAENSASDKSSADKSWAKPANRQGTRRRYSYAKRSAPVVETPPPPAQTSSLSWFRLRSQ
jgi:hypothetical protein